MKLHIFNPDHDLALAANQKIFTAPHAGRLLRGDLSFIPALWADDGDLVLVDDIDNARDKVRHLCGYENQDRVEFVTKLQLQKIFADTMSVDSIHPWGWNLSLKEELRRIGCPDIMLPTDETMQKIRELSSRQWASAHLQSDVKFVSNLQDLILLVQQMQRAVVKAPWSSSGRGVRYLTAQMLQDPGFSRWAERIIEKQGGVTVEPYYNKVKDFGMEFEMLDGKVHYLGLSLFDTVKNAYTGNLLCSEEEKVEIMKKYISEVALLSARQKIIDIVEPALKENYNGPFGVDMMIAAKDGQLELVSCVELNLRRTMGHVALELAKITKPQSLMRVDFDGNRYHLRVLPGKEAVNES